MEKARNKNKRERVVALGHCPHCKKLLSIEDLGRKFAVCKATWGRKFPIEGKGTPLLKSDILYFGENGVKIKKQC